ncbi:hypothetical protein FWH30_00815, partial [Microgenomates group bacterium]|nr:hypothetical protein [Microgenomates group bacterium]
KTAGEESEWSEWKNGESQEIELEEDGWYEFVWQQRDGEMNEGRAVEIKCPLILDRQSPKSEIYHFNQDIEGNLGIYYEVSDNGAPQKEIGVYYRFQAKNGDWEGSFTLAGTYENQSEGGMVFLDKDLMARNGYYQIITIATDLAGNIEEWPLETTEEKVYYMQSRAGELPTVLVYEELSDREYIVPLAAEADLDYATLAVDDRGWLQGGGGWRVFNQGAVSVVGKENGVEPKLGSKMLKFNGQAEQSDFIDVWLNYNTGGWYPRTVTLNYQIISNQPEGDLGDIGLVVHLGAGMERVVEIDGSELGREKIDGWYRSGWQQIQLAPTPRPKEVIEDGPNNGMILLSMNHDLALGKEVYIYLDKIEYDQTVLSSRSKIRLKNNHHYDYPYVGYEYMMDGEIVAERGGEGGDLYLRLEKTPDEGKVVVWLENEGGERAREASFGVEIDNQPPSIDFEMMHLEQVGVNMEQLNMGDLWVNYLELKNREVRAAGGPKQNIYYMATSYQLPQYAQLEDLGHYITAEHMKQEVLTGRKNNLHGPKLAWGQDRLMFFHYRRGEEQMPLAQIMYYYGIFIDPAYNVSSFTLDLERQTCTPTI